MKYCNLLMNYNILPTILCGKGKFYKIYRVFLNNMHLKNCGESWYKAFMHERAFLTKKKHFISIGDIFTGLRLGSLEEKRGMSLFSLRTRIIFSVLIQYKTNLTWLFFVRLTDFAQKNYIYSFVSHWINLEKNRFLNTNLTR